MLVQKVKNKIPVIIKRAQILCIIGLLCLTGVIICLINKGTISFTTESPYKNLDTRKLLHIEAWRKNLTPNKFKQ